jgi:pyruvate/2-oxoglutarate dehydrogenase complex dihydrolipoamide dehydrogenase (E3) component
VSATVYDLIVIGGGTAGLTAAGFAARLGVRVALVEKTRIGGDCTWTGCVPSKALLKVAQTAHTARTAARFGIHTGPITVDMAQVRASVQQAVQDVYQHETPEALARDGIETIIGQPRFVDRQTLQVGEQTLTARKFILATGARPLIPAISGLDSVPYVTYEQVFDLDTLPGRLVIIGAGPVGMELAQAFQRLGAQVTVIGKQVLPRMDREAAALVEAVLAREGVQFVEALATSASVDGADVVVRAGEQAFHADRLLVAAGRVPNAAGLGLEQAGVAYSDAGIQVDRNLRTSAPNIYAAGDCVGSYQFTHFAGWQAFTAVRNALLPLAVKGFADVVPWALFTDPEAAHVGMTETQARHFYSDDVRVTRRDLSRVDRAVSDGQTDGFIKVVHTRGGELLGATIVAPRASETITEFALALTLGLDADTLAKVIHVYPTYSSGVQLVLADIATEKALSGPNGRALKALARRGR